MRAVARSPRTLQYADGVTVGSALAPAPTEGLPRIAGTDRRARCRGMTRDVRMMDVALQLCPQPTAAGFGTQPAVQPTQRRVTGIIVALLIGDGWQSGMIPRHRLVAVPFGLIGGRLITWLPTGGHISVTAVPAVAAHCDLGWGLGIRAVNGAQARGLASALWYPAARLA